jgi:hypothetical protein
MSSDSAEPAGVFYTRDALRDDYYFRSLIELSSCANVFKV